MQEKQQLRRRLKKEACLLTAKERQEQSNLCVKAFRQFWLDQGSSPILGYMPLAHEIDLTSLWQEIWNQGLPVWLPRSLNNRKLSWCPITSPSDLQIGAYGVHEPCPSISSQDLPSKAVVAVPGVGWGDDGRRLGQGGGYYDLFLSRLDSNYLTVGLGFSCQQVNDLPLQEHDIKVKALLIGGLWIKNL